MVTPDRKQTILIVDDEPSNVNLLAATVPQGITVLFATNGEDALKIAASEKPDLVLLDIEMPGMDGYEVCARIKGDARTRDILVVFVTVLHDVEDEKRGLEVGAIDYIRKPIRPAIVRARVKNLLELKRRRDILEGLSSIDGLTCIPDRRGFEEAVNIEWRRAARAGAWLSLLLMDIDQFKSFNEKYGNVAGDDCLKMIAQSLCGAFRRASDFVARYGDDEFVALLPGTGARAAVEIAETLSETIVDLGIEHAASTVSDRVTMSVGAVSTVPDLDASHDTLVEVARQTLLEAKQAGGGQVISTVL